MSYVTEDQLAPDPAATRAQPAWAVLALVALGSILVAWCIRNCYVDDAFTGFQYLANFVAGRGFVFHAGDPPVEGVTNIGWLLLLAPLSSIWEPTVVAKTLGLILFLAAMTLTLLVGKKLESTFPTTGPGRLDVLPMLLLAVNFDFVYFSLAGMETAFLAVILLLMAWTVLRRPASLALPILAAMAFLVHPEAVAVYPIYLLLLGTARFFGCPTLSANHNRYVVLGATAGSSNSVRSTVGQTGDRSKVGRDTRHSRSVGALDCRRLALGFSILLLLVGAITAARFGYFHDVVPNTFHSKPSKPWQIGENGLGFLMGWNTNIPYRVPGWLLLPILWLGYRKLDRAAPAAARMLLAIAGTGTLFAVYSRPDWTETARYFTPYLPAALILSWGGIVEGVERLPRGHVRPAARRVLRIGLAAILLLIGVSDDVMRVQKMDWFPGYVMTGKHLVPAALWVRDHLPRDATIATRRIGVLAYYSGHPVFDYTYGLPDHEVACLVAKNGDRFDLPTDATLAKVWQVRAPDYLLEDRAVIDAIAKSAGGKRGRFSIHGLQYRELAQFPVGYNAEWVLAGRVAERQ